MSVVSSRSFLAFFKLYMYHSMSIEEVHAIILICRDLSLMKIMIVHQTVIFRDQRMTEMTIFSVKPSGTL